MNDPGFNRKQDQARVEAFAGLKRGLDAVLLPCRGIFAIRDNETVATECAIGDQRSSLAIIGRRERIPLRILDEGHGGEFDGIRKASGVQIEGAQSLLERAYLFRASENAEQTERKSAASYNTSPIA